MLSLLNRPRPHWLGLIVTVVILVSVAYGGNDDDDESPTTLPTSTAGPPTATVAPPAAAAAPQATATLSQPAAATSAATSPAASGGGDYCVDLGSGPFDDDINVPADATCTLDGVTINANVKLARNATLHAHGATIDGDVQAEESAAVNVLDGTTVGGNIQVEHSGSVQVVGARVDGDIQLEHNDGAHVVNDNTVDGNIQLEHNTGGVEARNNTVDGNLQCEENAPAPSGGGNTVRGTRKASARGCKEGEYRVYMMEQPWVDFDAIREKTDLVIVPTGAVEVYGTHLPVGTDTIVVTHVARQVGERLGAPVLPALPVGFSRSLGDFPGTLSISTPTLMAYLRETAESVAGWGFKRFLFINSHRGNIGPVGEVAMALQDEHGARCAQVFW